MASWVIDYGPMKLPASTGGLPSCPAARAMIRSSVPRLRRSCLTDFVSPQVSHPNPPDPPEPLPPVIPLPAYARIEPGNGKAAPRAAPSAIVTTHHKPALPPLTHSRLERATVTADGLLAQGCPTPHPRPSPCALHGGGVIFTGPCYHPPLTCAAGAVRDSPSGSILKLMHVSINADGDACIGRVSANIR
jgi:hypothetical protein